MSPRRLLGGRSPSRFLRHYWQRRPLLVRGAVPTFVDPVDRRDLFRLAAHPEVESRLVLRRGGRRPWQVEHGPIAAARFDRLPPRDWTLLVQGVDRQVRALADLLDAFSFVPTWRLDDVMVSFARPGGTVGPHLDSYDVFLLQGRGRRRWQLGRRPDPACRPGLDLRILRRFRADEDWVLEPGDLLYVPPGVAHYGVALEDCLTYSIGFRAPSDAELVAAGLRWLARQDPVGAYRDPTLHPTHQPGAIRPREIASLRARIDAAVARLGGPGFDAIVGALLTEAASPGAAPRTRRLKAAVLRAWIRSGTGLRRTPSSRVAFIRRGRQVALFANGRRYELSGRLRRAAPLLTRREMPASALAPLLQDGPGQALLLELVNEGVLAPSRPAAEPRSAAPRGGRGSPRGRGSRSATVRR
jgi:50S ribosomal protein L16 3-hydroxylase